MRYFVYHDAQIMGPFTREDLGQVHGLTGDSLICSEASKGAKDTEWRTAVEIQELSSLFSSGGTGLKAAPALEMSVGGPPDVHDRLTEENRILFDGFGYGGEWTSGIFEDQDFFRQWGSLVESATSQSEELELAKVRAEALQKSLDEMGSKLSRYERQQNEILERLNLKDRALEEKEKTLKALEAKLPALERALESAREELRQARDRLAEFQAGRVPAAWSAAAAAPPPIAAPPAPAAVTAPAPVAEPEARRVEPPAPALEPLAPSFEPPAPAFEPPAPVFESPLAAAAAPPPRVEAAPAFVPPPPVFEPPIPVAPSEPSARPKLELPATVRLKPSTMRPSGRAFTPPVPVPSNVDLVGTAPPKASAPEPSSGLQPLSPFEASSSWGPQTPAIPTPLPGPAVPAEPEAAASEPVVFSPEPAQPPETLVERRAATPPVPALDLLAPADPLPVPSPETAPDLPPIPTPEPMPGAGGGASAPFGTAGRAPTEIGGGTSAPYGAVGGLVELTLTPAPRRLSPEPAAPSEIPDVSTPARLEPVGALDRPHTTMRSVGGPSGAVPLPAAQGLFPDLSTPAPIAGQAHAPAPAAEPPTAPSPKIPSRPPAPTTETAAQPGAATMQRRRQSKTFLIGLGVAFAGLLAAGVFFLKDPKEVIQLFTMSPKKGRRVDPEQIATPAPTSLSQVKPMAASVTTPDGAQKPPENPPPGRDFVADSTVAAMDFAKQQSLGKGKANLGKWLSSTYLKRGDEEEWSAGAVEGGVYLVSYRYFKGGKTAKQEPVTYLFEVDLDKKGIKGRNPVARDLLAGAAKSPAARKSAKRPKKRRAASMEEAAPAEEEAPAPLDDLLGPPSQEPATPGAELMGE